MRRHTRSRGGWGILLFPLLLLAVVLFYFLRTRGEVRVPTSATTPAVIALRHTFDNLPFLPDGHYELWERREHGGENRLSAFRVLEGGTLVSLSGEPLLETAIAEFPPSGTTLLVTVEDGAEPVNQRSERVLLQGALSLTEANLTAVVPPQEGSHRALLAAPTGKSQLATAGVWFVVQEGKKGVPQPGLELPALDSGWVYAGWVVTGAGTTLPTGKFSNPRVQDDFSGFSGSAPSFGLPGEDFLKDSPEGVRFPLNLADGRSQVIISIEPDFPGESERAEPFLPLLFARIPYQQQAGEEFSLEPAEADLLPQGRIVIEQRSTSTRS